LFYKKGWEETIMSSIIDVLIVDDEKDWMERLEELAGKELTTHKSSTLEEALSYIRKRFYYCALVDKSLIPGEGDDKRGMRVLEALIELGEGTRGLMLTAYGDVPSVRAALRQWKATDYVEKKELRDMERFKEIQDQIHKMIDDAKADYAERYGSGIHQLTVDLRDPEHRTIWTSNVLSTLAVAGEGGLPALSKFLDELLKEIPPLIPYEPGEPPRIDKTTATVEGRYWSTGRGESVLVRFGRRADIEAEKQALAPETVIQHISHEPYGGLILRAGLRFEDLP